MYKLIQLKDKGFKEITTYISFDAFKSEGKYKLDKSTFLVYAAPDFLDIDKDSQTKIIQEVIRINDGRITRFSSGVKIEKVESPNSKSACGHACWCMVDSSGRYCETYYCMRLPSCDGLCCWYARCPGNC
ncbi:hypothetical protein [Poritiphilus flavus]|uniref:Uncharacterized protein n=1 Tax=Poritiphilus flavus TaxID=2697053 RepID=A0A6L9E7A3_9FLAO|nr:hypothetical protein [Poritiphilus flavus]NAS10597.1 hypothetical protein [Poritiphilus flavus]